MTFLNVIPAQAGIQVTFSKEKSYEIKMDPCLRRDDTFECVVLILTFYINDSTSCINNLKK